MVGAGIEVPITQARLERVLCDCEHIGDLENDEVTRLKTAIPAATRRKVFVRDTFQCVVPGCRSGRYLAIHHLVARVHGGTHSMSNLILLCDAHHTQHHDGILLIGGTAPDQLTLQLAVSPSWD